MEFKYFESNNKITGKGEEQLSEYIEKGLEKRPGYVLGADSNENDKILGSLKALNSNDLAHNIDPATNKKLNSQINNLDFEINENFINIKEKLDILKKLENELESIKN